MSSDNTIPALFSPSQIGRDADAATPIAQLGAGPDGSALLARRGERLVEIMQLAFGPESPRWPELAARVRTLAAVDHPGVRAIVALDELPPQLVLEGDRSPPLAELIEQASVDLARALAIVAELARAVAAAHHVGLCHGGLHPWSVHVDGNDRPRIELTQLATKPVAHAQVAACAAPELALEVAEPDAAADVYAIGRLLDLFARSAGRAAGDTVVALIAAATHDDPDCRPTAVELARRLALVAAAEPPSTARGSRPSLPKLPSDTVVGGRTTVPPMNATRPAVGLALGRFELARRLGAGAMGEVWEATDTTGGPNVAMKLLRAELAVDDELLRRFRKEARVLARVGSPYIANYVDLNEDAGIHYLVLELVTGGSVHGALRRLGKLPERLALGIVADACRALSEPHRLGVVHRDLKPDNMMFVRAGIELEAAPLGQLIKLGDFGIARLVEDARGGGAGGDATTGATREGTVLGTPEFMAPEQCQGAKVTAATDVYALGCCLFTLIAGRTPFEAGADDPSQMGVILAHINVPPPRLDEVFREASPAVAEVVARCLEKTPSRRYADASELLTALERLYDGDTALVAAHPAPPVYRASRVQTYAFEWELQSSPDKLWPFVSNTEKMNRATGLAPVHFEIESVTGDRAASHTTGNQRVAGMQMRWREHPYEWIEGTRHVVLRVFDKGVLRWYIADVQLDKLPNGGTRLRNTIRLEPRGPLARLLSRWEIGVKYKRALDRVYKRLDGVLAAGAPPDVDPIEPEVELPEAVRSRIATIGDALVADGADPAAVEALTSYVLHRGDQDVARMRPLELAARFRVPEDAMIDAALRAAKHGLLVMVWDVICPSCRIPSNVVESLAKIEQHARCTACNIAYDVDFSRAIELAFRASPELRQVETRTFCIGGPAHFPHVAAQVRLAPSERLALPLALGPGYYLVRSPQLARVHELRVVPSGGVRRLDLTLGEAGDLAPLTAGDQLLALANPAPRELLVRVERAGDRAFALTAARVMSVAVFRELFPDQSLAPGRLMAVTQASLVIAQLDAAAELFKELGDEKAFPVAARFFEQVGALAKELGGSLVKTFGGLAIAAFERPGPAVECALRVQRAADEDALTHGLGVRVVVHRGPLMAMSHGGRLDYFGQNLEAALAMVADVPPAAVAVTNAVCFDPGVAERVAGSPDQLGIVALGEGAWQLRMRATRADVREAPTDSRSTVVNSTASNGMNIRSRNS
jgi:serine/threonine protein kinase|nr:protein kinase [Kofleriaceae bacterium]